MSRFLQLDATTWLEPQTGMVIADPGKGTPLTVTIGGTVKIIPANIADMARATLNHNPNITPPTVDDPGMTKNGVSWWKPGRTGM